MIKDTDLREGLYVMTRGTVGCGLTGFECFFACDSMNALYLVLEE